MRTVIVVRIELRISLGKGLSAGLKTSRRTLEQVRPFLYPHDNRVEYDEIHNVMGEAEEDVRKQMDAFRRRNGLGSG